MFTTSLSFVAAYYFKLFISYKVGMSVYSFSKNKLEEKINSTQNKRVS